MCSRSSDTKISHLEPGGRGALSPETAASAGDWPHVGVDTLDRENPTCARSWLQLQLASQSMIKPFGSYLSGEYFYHVSGHPPEYVNTSYTGGIRCWSLCSKVQMGNTHTITDPKKDTLAAHLSTRQRLLVQDTLELMKDDLSDLGIIVFKR